MRVEEFFPLGPDETVPLTDGADGAETLPDTRTGTWWSEDVTALPGTDIVTRYAAGPLAGRPAVTRRDVGTGAAWYLSTLPADADLGALLDRVLSAAGVEPTVNGLPLGVETTRRSDGSRSWLFLLNHTDAEQQVEASGHDLVSDTAVAGTVTLAPGGCAVLREE